LIHWETIFIFGLNAENFMKFRQGMTSGECVENKWFNMKCIGKYLSVEIRLTHGRMSFLSNCIEMVDIFREELKHISLFSIL
jgi:hypothetical protein